MSVRHGISSGLEQRLVSCLPGASFEMETLCRLAGVVESRETETAAVECVARPRLLVNPDFVAEFCARDEHLFLLVMHELWHVILAHTRLYPRVTPEHNIAFDAVINAGLAWQFSGPESRGFFESLNPADAFPGCLLRPPVGWPARPVYPDCGPKGTGELLRRLYPRFAGYGTPTLPTYGEILELLERKPKGRGKAADPVPFLLGDHGDGEGDERAMSDELFGGTIRRIVAQWPPPPFPVAGRDSGGSVSDWLSPLEQPGAATRKAFARTLRRALGHDPGARARRTRTPVDVVGGLGVLPSAADRLAPGRRALGLPGTLWAQRTTTMARIPERPASAHVYLDVSGSMSALLPHLSGLLLPYVQRGEARVFQFSTEVEPLPLAELRRGKLKTTYGTDIRCVFEHALATPRLKRLLILTDGYTGPPSDDQRLAIAERRLAIHVVLPAESAWRRDLETVARTITVLSPLH